MDNMIGSTKKTSLRVQELPYDAGSYSVGHSKDRQVNYIGPSEHLKIISKYYPNVWKSVKNIYLMKSKKYPTWPNWCLLPLYVWFHIVAHKHGVKKINDRIHSDVMRLAPIGTWRYSQGIYRFDKELYDNLQDTPVCKELPCDVFYHLPEWCVYIETPGMQWQASTLHGFWCYLDWDYHNHNTAIKLLLNSEVGQEGANFDGSSLLPFSILLGPWSLKEGILKSMDIEVYDSNGKPLDDLVVAEIENLCAQNIYKLLSLVLYLCSEEPEIDNEKTPNIKPSYGIKQTKGGPKLFAAAQPRIWNVGSGIGEKLRIAHTGMQKGGHAVSPHLRRAHWHGFWTGPREGERKFKYKWLSPILVSGSKVEDK